MVFAMGPIAHGDRVVVLVMGPSVRLLGAQELSSCKWEVWLLLAELHPLLAK